MGERDLASIDAELPQVAGERYDGGGMRAVNLTRHLHLLVRSTIL
jgi:hypothetical protein